MDAVAALPPIRGLIAAACAGLGLARATFHRRQAAAILPPAPALPRPKPARTLADHERQRVIDVLREPQYVDLAPAEIYASLLDQGVYHCSIRTMCIGSLANMGKSKSAVGNCVIPFIRSPSCWPKAQTKSGHGISVN
jgi:hypothetical protein